jgi:POT family proton-dependent oligopeptide transporter
MIISLTLFASLRRHTVEGETVNQATHKIREIELTPKQERDRIVALLLVFAIVVVFWMVFHQNGLTLTFWARDCTNTTLPPELMQAINPFFVLFFTPLLVAFWIQLRRRRKEPSTAAKIGIGMLLTACSYAIITVAALVGGNIGRVSIAWLISTYAVITLGELCLSPMGLALANKLAPARLRGLMMGGWFTATAIGNYLSGLAGSFWDRVPHSTLFLIFSLCSVGAAGVLLLVLKRIRPTIAEAERMALESAAK